MSDTTWFSDESASVIVDASPADILAVVTNAPQLPAWNPAFSSVSRKDTGSFTVVVRGLLRGTLQYLDHPAGVT
ncbi:MAG: hypothetical protein L0L18_08515, partial [Acidipropionibacterium jensenii]|nr:hypothetical protein [Acidipropionibacterium jensenii]